MGCNHHYSIGNRLTQESSIGGLPSTVDYTYDIANRLTDVNGVTYTWDANGNLLNDGVNTYTYTSNKLSSISGENLNVTFQYRCNGLSSDQWGIIGCDSDRVSQTVNGVTTDYVLDIASPLTQVLQDRMNTYVYGVDRIAQISGATPEYFLTDGLGSVRQLVDGTGIVTFAKSYEPFGSEVSSVGNGSTSYAFAGEMADSTGLIYLRARYYASETGRFLTKDTWLGDFNRPLSLNGWNYVEGNPVNYTDPTVNISQADDLTAQVIAADLRIRFNVEIIRDWGYISSSPMQTIINDFIDNGYLKINTDCGVWETGNWRTLGELELVRDGVELLAGKMGGPEKFKSAMKHQKVEIARVRNLLYPFKEEGNTGLTLPYIVGYYMVRGIMLPDLAFNFRPEFAVYTTIHEMGHLWDVRSNLALSIGMAEFLGNAKNGNVNSLSLCKDYPIISQRYRCATGNWQYIEANEIAPGQPGGQYARLNFTEDWAEAVAYTVYPQYGRTRNYLPILDKRKTYVEVWMSLIR